MKKLFIISCLLGTVSIQAQLTIQDSLVAHYRFKGNTNDVSGNGNHGTNNGASLTTDRFGWPNSAYEFNGTSSWISTNSTFDYPERTISLWVYPTSASGTGVNAPFAMSQDANTLSYGVIQVAYSGGTLQLHAGGETPSYNAGAAVLSKWLHIVLVRTATSTLYYLDGTLASTGTSGTLASATFGNTTCVIGTGRKTTDQFFAGKIDDIRIYNRALTAAEVDTLYNETTTGINSNKIVDTDWMILSNPVVGPNISIKFNKSTTGIFTIMDGVGRVVKRIDVNAYKREVINISIEDLSNGTYFIRNTSNQFAAKKVMLIK